jgi:hypothetical protein
MSSYRIARRLSAAAGVVEAFIGLEADSRRGVVVKRLVSPWAREAPDFGVRFAADSRGYRGVPGLTEWLEVGAARDSVWLVQSLVDGEGLRHILNALSQLKGFITPNEGLAVVGQLAALVATLHAREEPLVHGDICASTVLLTPGGDLLLTDPGLTLGLSRSPTSGPPRAEPFTIAPEQLSGPSGTATDIFRIGLLLHELAVGHPLFFAADPVQALVQCQRYTGVSEAAVAQVPQPWRSLLVRMLAVEPDERPGAAEVDRALREAAQQAGWRRLDQDIARLVQRANPERQSLLELARGGAQELVLGPVTPQRVAVTTPPQSPVAAVASPGRGSPAVSGVHVSLSPPADEPAERPRAPAPTPVAPPQPSAPGSGNAVVGRIATRKMSRSELHAARGEPAEESRAARASQPPARDPRAPRDVRVGALLVSQGVITAAQLEEATQSVAIYGGTLAEALQSNGATDEDTIVATVAGVTHTPHTTAAKLAEMPPPLEALQKVPLELARRLEVVPLGLKGGTQLMVAMRDPMDAAAQEQLKVAAGVRSIVAVRAGENAIRRTRNRFYVGADSEFPEWLERPPPPPAPRPAPGTSTSGELPVVSGSMDLAPASAPGAQGASLEGGCGRLVLALLKMLDDRGAQALSLAALAGGLANRLGAAAEEVERVRFAAVALAVANLLDGRPVHDVPGLSSLSGVLGEAEWNAVEPLVSAWLSWPTEWPPGAAGQGLCLAFSFTAHVGGPRPRGSALGAALASYRPQGGASRTHLEALLAELGSA